MGERKLSVIQYGMSEGYMKLVNKIGNYEGTVRAESAIIFSLKFIRMVSWSIEKNK